LRELWGDAAAFVDPHDAAAWRDELNRLARNTRRREELANRAQAHAGRYTAETAVAQYVALYRSLLGIVFDGTKEAAA
jgi:glycosyltransferase involved in cell wall biosynthesis